MIAGFYHVDNETREGIAKLTAAIAAEAANLPDMGRSYPRSWRWARDSLAAVTDPYLSYKAFERALGKVGLDSTSARSFARNSHKLGHLIHYADEPGIADLVVLRPDWLSRAISYVLEDTVAFQAHGLVSHRRLAELWNDDLRPADERYPSALHPMLLRLMERFDISYRVATGSEDRSNSRLSLVGQLVPETATLEGVWLPSITDGRNEITEVIQVIDAETRRILSPEGLLYQLIVRLHRFSLGRVDHRKAVHWQRGVVLDDTYNGTALLRVTTEGIRVTVRGAYPQFLMHQLTEEIRWLVETFWRGLDAKRKVPCPTPCGLKDPGAGLFDVERLLREKEHGTDRYPCPECGEWQKIDDLLMGVVRPSTYTNMHDELAELSLQLRKLSHDVAGRLDRQEQLHQELMSRSEEHLAMLLHTFDDEGESGPRLFTVIPVDGSIRRPGLLSQRFRVTLYCEHSKLPLSVLSDQPSVGRYDVDFTREWVVKAAPILRLITKALGVALPVTKAIGVVTLDDVGWRDLESELEDAKDALTTMSESATAAAKTDPEGKRGLAPESPPSGSVLRNVHSILRQKDPGFGGLEKVRTNRGEAIWVHPRFVEIYRPGPPTIS